MRKGILRPVSYPVDDDDGQDENYLLLKRLRVRPVIVLLKIAAVHDVIGSDQVWKHIVSRIYRYSVVIVHYLNAICFLYLIYEPHIRDGIRGFKSCALLFSNTATLCIDIVTVHIFLHQSKIIISLGVEILQAVSLKTRRKLCRNVVALFVVLLLYGTARVGIQIYEMCLSKSNVDATNMGYRLTNLSVTEHMTLTCLVTVVKIHLGVMIGIFHVVAYSIGTEIDKLAKTLKDEENEAGFDRRKYESFLDRHTKLARIIDKTEKRFSVLMLLWTLVLLAELFRLFPYIFNTKFVHSYLSNLVQIIYIFYDAIIFWLFMWSASEVHQKGQSMAHNLRFVSVRRKFDIFSSVNSSVERRSFDVESQDMNYLFWKVYSSPLSFSAAGMFHFRRSFLASGFTGMFTIGTIIYQLTYMDD